MSSVFYNKFRRQESNVLFDRLDITGDHEIEFSGLDAFSSLLSALRAQSTQASSSLL